MQTKNNNHGGARPGSGRKKGTTKVPASFRIETELLEKIKDLNKNRFVNEAIREKLDREGILSLQG